MIKSQCGIQYVEAGNPESERKIFMLHGYGADMMDLYPLAQEIDPIAHWIFPNGVLEVPIGPFMTGRGWFQIDFPQFERAMRSGEFSQSNPNGMTEARKKIVEFINAFEFDMSEVVIGGFSQGAMLTTDLVLNTELQPRGLLLLSATLVKKNQWKEAIQARASSNKQIPFFQSHGTHDPVLPYPLAEELHQILVEAGWKGDLETFRGGHEIPYTVIEGAQEFLSSL